MLIVVGETGSGKTTQLTQYIYEAGMAEKGKIGFVPRHLSLVSLTRPWFLTLLLLLQQVHATPSCGSDECGIARR